MLRIYKTSTHITMKKICLLLAMAGTVLAMQSVHAQSGDTTKNKIEIKKKVKIGAHGRQVTKIRMEGKGTPGAITGSVDGAVSGKAPVAAPQPQPRPTVVVVHDPAPTPVPATTTVTTTTEAKRMPVTTTHVTKTTTSTSHVVHTTRTKPVYHKTTYKRHPVTASATQTTTTVKRN